jgi:hypothetical protein
MFDVGSLVYVQFDEPGQGGDASYRPAAVAECDGSKFVAEFADHVFVSVGARAAVRGNIDEKFSMATAKVQAFLRTKPRPALRFVVIGQPELAELRSTFRVSAAGVKLTAELADETDCDVLDVSVSGVSAITPNEYTVGQQLQVAICNEGKRFVGRARVCSVRPFCDGRHRLGLQVLAGEHELAGGLQRVSMAVQREHLRRLSAST